MPIGIFINCGAVALGGILGSFVGGRMNEDFKEKLTMIFGICSFGMGAASVILMQNMPAVVLAVVLGTAFGLAVHLGDLINKGGAVMQRGASKIIRAKEGGMSEEQFQAALLTVIVLFCSSGTGIYGAMVCGISGDHSILITKAILDFCTALLFSCSLGMVVALVAIPQFIIMMILYLVAGAIYPMITPVMLNDFKACGGMIMIASGFRIAKIKMFPTADMIPAMILVMPISALWVNYIVPLLS